MDERLMHYGVKGMKWGQHIFGKVKDRQKRIVRRQLDKETERLVADSKHVQGKYKAEPGRTKDVYGEYQKKFGPIGSRRLHMARHIIDEYGDVKVSFFHGPNGYHFVAAGKEAVNKIDLKRHFISLEGTWDYDVYK